MRHLGPLEAVERDALDEEASVAGALRKCLSLGSQTGSGELREWATKELRGYTPGAAEIPEYRTVPAVIMYDSSNLAYHVTGHVISPMELPDFARDTVKEQVTFYHGVGELESIVVKSQRDDKPLNMSFPHSADLAAYMTHENPGVVVHRIYHNVNVVAIEGILDRTRTTLVELVAAMRDGLAREGDEPSAELATQAVNVVVHGRGNRVQWMGTQIGNHPSNAVPQGDEGPRWKRWSIVAALVAAVAALIGALNQWIW